MGLKVSFGEGRHRQKTICSRWTIYSRWTLDAPTCASTFRTAHLQRPKLPRSPWSDHPSPSFPLACCPSCSWSNLASLVPVVEISVYYVLTIQWERKSKMAVAHSQKTDMRHRGNYGNRQIRACRDKTAIAGQEKTRHRQDKETGKKTRQDDARQDKTRSPWSEHP